MKYWLKGDTIVIRNIAKSDGSVSMAIPAIAICDDDILALYVPPGTTYKDNYVIAPQDRVSAVTTSLPSNERPYVDRVWSRPTIRLYLPDAAFSVWAFFNEQAQFVSWYGNLEAPYLRTSIGIDTRDHALDVVADAEGHWQWKDEAEFERRLTAGIDTPEHQASVRAAGLEFIKRIKHCQFPFNQDWQYWQAPEHWTPRPLPVNWKEDFGTSRKLRH
jgi:protein associated with RNAse G/E